MALVRALCLRLTLPLRLGRIRTALIILSGTLICQSEWSLCLQKNLESSFFRVMEQKTCFNLSNGKNLETLLRENGMSGEFVSFNGGHEIPDKVLKRLSQYLLR